MTKIVIIDDHPVVRDGMSAMLENESDFSVVCSAKSGEDAVDFVRKHGEPSIVVSDIRMPGMDGFETLAKLRRFYPEIRVLLLAGMPLKVEEERARAEGARGYLPKSLDWERLVSAIRIAAKDGDFIADDFDEPKVGPLSRREIDVLTYIAQGKTHEEIGIIGGISAETVRTHMKSILRKLDCANAPAAVSRAYELGILRA